MCCIIIVPKNVEIPSRKTLLQVYDANPDGIGFACDSMIYKTLDFEAFYNRVKQIPKEENLVIHFRWATHGSVCLENVHPFVEDGTVFFHNGVLPIASKNDMTDSEICFREILMPSIKQKGIKRSERLINAQRGSSRFVLMQGGRIYHYGDFTSVNGCLYSNMRWVQYERCFSPFRNRRVS